MSERSEKANAVFGHGCNCAQAVFVALADATGMDETTARNVARAFGGGVGRHGKMCGAVTGAVMALGCKYNGQGMDQEPAARTQSYGDVAEFFRRFEEKFGALDCRDLLGVQINTDEGQAVIKENDLITVRCRQYVQEAVKMVEDML